MNKNIDFAYVLQLLKEGKIKKTNEHLGYYFSLSGVVEQGKKMGKTIGFPTINLSFNINEQALPKMGCYVTLTKIEKKFYFGLTCLMKNKENIIICETWLEDFKQNVYQKKVKVFFCHFYRDNLPFISFKNIKNLIQNDLKQLKIKPKINYEMLK